MKRILFLLPLILFPFLSLFSQSWASKEVKSMLTLKTFSADGSLLSSSTGFFVGSNGEAISTFAPFKGAQRAIIIDAQGKEYAVEQMLGANETYDVAKFVTAARKTTPLPIAASANNGSDIWLMPYTVNKQPTCISGKINSAETFQDTYQYYTLAINIEESHVTCPILNNDGAVVGIVQPSAGGQKGVAYAVSARFANDLKITGLSINDPILRQTAIPIALPDDAKDAILTLFLASSTLNKTQFTQLINRFIQKFPNLPDGYINRARLAVSEGNFQAAEDDMQQAVKVGTTSDDVHYQYADIIYQKDLYQNDKVYLQQQAQIRFAQGKYAEAYSLYEQLTHTEMRSADIFFAASQCKGRLGDTNAQLALVDSAVNQFSRPYVKTAAPYLMARAQLLSDLGKFRLAVNDYNEYETLMTAQLEAPFYYNRSIAETGGHLFQQALNDINKAIEMAPSEPMYRAEKASLQVRVGQHKEAIETAQQLIKLSPELSDGYLFLGLAQCLTNQKAEGARNLNKAKELGNEQAQTLIDKYAK